MKQSFSKIFFVIIIGIIYSSSSLFGQTANNDALESPIKPKTRNPKKQYSMRIDFMTESQKDDIIQSGTVKLTDLCAYTMGCQSRKDIVLDVGDKIQLFKDKRIKHIELIRIDDNKKTTIGTSVTTSKESYITVNQRISRANLDNFMLFILK